jgi:NTP pyrophosphatase (non-canonical NTP hydrolase)
MNSDTNEVLVILLEECAEVVQQASKCMRFGPDQIAHNATETNMQLLEQEIADVYAMVELLIDLNIGVTEQGIIDKKQNKFDKLKLWSNLQINK